MRFSAAARLVGIASLNPVGGVDGHLLCLLCFVQVAVSANELITRSEESYRPCVSNYAWSRKLKRSGLGPIWTVGSRSRNKPKKYYGLNEPTKNNKSVQPHCLWKRKGGELWRSFTPLSVLGQVFRSEFSTECDLVLLLSFSNILSLPWGHPVAAYVFFLFLR
jgi:hypothetical protein